MTDSPQGLVERLLAEANRQANELADMLVEAADRIAALERELAAMPMLYETRHQAFRAMIEAYEDATGDRLPDAEGDDYRIVRAMYDRARAAIDAARKVGTEGPA